MISGLKTRALLGVLALLIAGITYTQMPQGKSEAAVTGGGFFTFTYSTATQRATWTFRWTHNDTFGPQVYSFLSIAPPGSEVIAASAALNCGTLPSALPVCTTAAGVLPPSPLEVTISSPFPQTCTAFVATIGPVSFNNSNFNNPTGTVFTQPASITSDIGGVQQPNSVPANLTLCPTPIPNTPTPTTTPVPPAVLPVIPQVFQHVPQGIFNGSRNNTPTPVRPVGTAGSTGVGLPPSSGAMPVLRPPSTGDAGLLTLQKLGVW